MSGILKETAGFTNRMTVPYPGRRRLPKEELTIYK